MKLIKLCSYILCLMCVVVLTHAPIMSIATDAAEMLEILKSMDKSIQFYGKVLDQNNNPVTGAQVLMNVRGSMGIKEISRITDNAGFFIVNNETGNLLFIESIDKTGYEFSVENNLPISFRIDEFYVFDPAKPVIFKLRKKEPPATVIPWEYVSLLFNLKTSGYELDLIKSDWDSPGQFGKAPFLRDKHVDVLIKGKLAADQKSYELTVETPDQGSGVILGDTLLYVVPEQGYQQKEKLIVPLQNQMKKYVYIKSRNGKVYARLDFEIKTTEETMIVSMNSWTNPTGSRNVDYDEDMFGEWLGKVSQ
jgi:hypothetical protein